MSQSHAQGRGAARARHSCCSGIPPPALSVPSASWGEQGAQSRLEPLWACHSQGIQDEFCPDLLAEDGIVLCHCPGQSQFPKSRIIPVGLSRNNHPAPRKAQHPGSPSWPCQSPGMCPYHGHALWQGLAVPYMMEQVKPQHSLSRVRPVLVT